MKRLLVSLVSVAALVLTGCTATGTVVCTQGSDGVVTCKATPSASPSTSAPTAVPSPTSSATPTPSAPSVTSSPTQSASPTASTTQPTTPPATATPSSTGTPTSTATPTGSLPSGVSLKQIDGGPAYNAKFSPGLPTDPGFFPIGVFYESTDQASNIAFDKATGINFYAGSTANPNTSAIRSNGMYLFPWADQTVSGKGSETVGYLLEDEPDMMNPGWWNAPHPEQFTYMDKKLTVRPGDGRANYTNYGIGILSAADGDANAKNFVKKYSDYPSADCYMYYYPSTYFEASRCIGKGDQRLTLDQQERGRNYGIMVERMRGFADYLKPVWSFVEVTGITPGQLRSAMWHSIIGGARGVVFFNHQFEGTCQTQHALRESCYATQRAMVQSVTSQIRDLASVINAPDVQGLTTTSAGVTALTKWNEGQPVIFAGNNDNASKSATFTVKGKTSGTVTVVGENRNLTMTNGSFTDTFANGDAIHIYKVN